MTIPNAKKTVLPNGVRVLTEEIPSIRSVAMGIMVGAGSGNETNQEAGISHFIEHMMFKGTPKRSSFQIAHALDSVGGKMNAYTSKEVTMYYAVVLDQHLEVAADVLGDMFINSIFDPKEMETEKGVVLEEIKMYEDTPDELIHDLFAEKILHGHPLGKPTIGFNETVGAIAREDIQKYRQRLYTPNNIIVSLAGAVPKNAMDLLLPYFGGISGGEFRHEGAKAEIKANVFLKKKKTEQAHLCLGVKGPSHRDKDRYAYSIMDNVLGGTMSSRLFQEVREKRGLAYAIYTASSPFRDFGLSYVYAGTGKETLGYVIELIIEQYKQLKKEGITKEEMTRAKEYIKGSMVLSLESSSSRMGFMARSELYHDRIQTVDEIFAEIDKVKPDDIVRLANQYFRNEELSLTVIADLDELPLKELKC
ncbi:MAG: insulinase family protein [Candidatus Margulisbacteria bacterium]|nr:insulinase family protein [Candidatus Margulisiibacteriota bacterium]MBU1616459.1 insulinase family protein [Candidatus Margulisiibacteriota bacterium]